MTDEIEAAAKRVCAVTPTYRDGAVFPTEWDDLSEYQRNYFRRIAVAALNIDEEQP